MPGNKSTSEDIFNWSSAFYPIYFLLKRSVDITSSALYGNHVQRCRSVTAGIFILALISCLPLLLVAQETVNKTYGVATISGSEAYKKMIAADSMKKLEDLEKYIPGILLDIKYAGKDNFLGTPVYTMQKAFLTLPAAEALKKVQQELKEKGFSLKIFDAYRPYQVTILFYEKVRDTIFVASPYRGSRHNRGAAVDLTIVDLATGKELDMPTPFDDFSKKAHSEYVELPAHIIANRELLKSVMVKYGFQVYADEWWHYDFKGWEKHPLMDVEFKTLD